MLILYCQIRINSVRLRNENVYDLNLNKLFQDDSKAGHVVTKSGIPFISIKYLIISLERCRLIGYVEEES